MYNRDITGYKQCSICKRLYPITQIESLWDCGEKQNYCVFCLEDIVTNDVPVKFIANYNRITRIPLKKLMNA